MLSMIMGFLGLAPKVFGTIDNITNAIANERLALINAKTAKEKQESLERLGRLEAQKDVLVAEAQPGASKLNTIFRFVGFGLPASIIIWNYIVWDKVMGKLAGCTYDKLPEYCHYFKTDGLSPEMWYAVMAAIGFYLVTSRR